MRLLEAYRYVYFLLLTATHLPAKSDSFVF
jgi:hypothetical protein